MVDKEKHEINGILIFQLKSLIHRLIVKKTPDAFTTTITINSNSGVDWYLDHASCSESSPGSVAHPDLAIPPRTSIYWEQVWQFLLEASHVYKEFSKTRIY